MRAVAHTEPDTPADTAPSDALAIERSLREPERFTQLFDRYYVEIHGYVARRLGASRADDVASETFLIAFDRRRRYDLACPSARPWLYGIASNLIARHRRAEVRRNGAIAAASCSDEDARGAGRRGPTEDPMNDLTILHDAWGEPEAPSQTSYARARAALTARAARRAPRLRVRVAAAGAVALAISIGLAVIQNLGGTGSDGRPRSVVPGLPALPVASAEILERAAKAAASKPFAPPRDDQWIYIEDRVTRPDGRTTTQRRWHRADGGGEAFIDEHGELQVQSMQPPRDRPNRKVPVTDTYKGLTTLPTDPDALLRWAYAQDIENGNTSKDGVVYLMFNHLLRGNLLPPELEAAIFRAMKQIPGVTVETVDVLGKPTLSLGFTDDWLREELLIYPRTYTYRGERSTVVKDARIDPLKAGNATGEVQKGSTVIVERLATAVVDEPGQQR
jgi:DNA-directed RNA polymerase specialized sigma24 family protein